MGAISCYNSFMDPEENSGQEAQALPRIEKITLNDLKVEIPEVNGSVIILQRNAKDKVNRTLGDTEKVGALDEGEAEKTKQEAKAYFDQVFQGLAPEERAQVDILVVASDASLNTPMAGVSSLHQRGMETAREVLAGAKASMVEFGVNSDQLLNIYANEGQPVPTAELIDLRMMTESPKFVQTMVEKHGSGQQFWSKYETDTDRDIREELKAEGPLEIANRLGDYMKLIAATAREYHAANPGRRLIVWADSHYDSISPFLKKYVAKMDEPTFLDVYLPVDYRAGIAIKVGASGETTTQLQGQRISLDLAFSGE